MNSVNPLLNNLTASSLTALPLINTELPAVDWQTIGAPDDLIPQPLPLPWQKPADPLPPADIVVVTWTAAEWNAMNQVFCASQRRFTAELDHTLDAVPKWQRDWLPYRYEFEQIADYLKEVKVKGEGGAPSLQNMAWARIRMVKVGDLNVLLFKSDMHLAQDGPKVPLLEFTRKICREARPWLILSIGTAGAVRYGDTLGSVLVSNQGYFDLLCKSDDPHDTVKEYIPEFAALNHTTVRSNWVPGDAYLATAKKGFIPISEPDVLPPTPAYEQTIIKAKRTSPEVEVVLDSPVITTDTFLFGSSDYELEKFGCIVEMDDAVVGDVCAKEGVAFGFVRNISDPVINRDLDNDLKSVWAAYIYKEYGLQSSYNGALTTWGLIAAMAEKTGQQSRDGIEWYEISPAPLRDSLALRPLNVGDADLLRQAYAFTDWQGGFFISHPNGLMRLTFDEEQSYFAARLMLETATPYQTLKPFIVKNVGQPEQLYLFAYQRDENRFDFFRIESDVARFVHSFPCRLEGEAFSVTHVFEGYQRHLLMAYDKKSGESRIYEIQERNGDLSVSLLWEKKWAPGWEHFSFFTLGKENFFFKTNVDPMVKNKMVNIDHYMDTPSDGAHPVCTTLPKEALNASAVAGIPLSEGPGLIFADENGFSVHRIHSDCQGWHCQLQKELKGSNKALYVLPLANDRVLLGIETD